MEKLISYDEWLKKQPEKNILIELQKLIARTIGEKYVSLFDFEISKEDDEYFEISADDKIYVKAPNGALACSALGYVYRHYLNVNVTEESITANIPSEVPKIKHKRIKTPYKVRFAFNYCTYGYTFPFFSREEWQHEIDFLLLSGINIIMDIGGYEAVWINFLCKFGYNINEILSFVPSAPYQPWWLMGNLEGTGDASLPFILDSLEMARERRHLLSVMGVNVAEQMYCGMLPNSFVDIANIKNEVKDYLVSQGVWTGGSIRPNIINPLCPTYGEIAKAYYESLSFVFGNQAKYYCGDICHEGGILPDKLSAECYTKMVFNALLAYNKDAVWVIQAWDKNPSRETIFALGKNKSRHLLVLDLCSFAKPLYLDEEKWGDKEFNNTPWVYCDLNNFGGRTGMHGDLKKLSSDVCNLSKKYKNLKGIGLLCEATYQNPITFEIFFDSIWSKTKVDQKIKKYIKARYGYSSKYSNKAWDILCESIYSNMTYDGTTIPSVYANYPLITKDYLDSPLYNVNYDESLLDEAIKLLLKDFNKLKDCKAYVYDLVDIVRQRLIIEGNSLYKKMAFALENRQIDDFKIKSKHFLKNLILIGKISNYNPNTTMSKWLGRIDEWTGDKRNHIYSSNEIAILKENAKSILTIWSIHPITYYSTRLYTGLIEDWILPEWKYLIKKLLFELKSGKVDLTQSIGLKRSFYNGYRYSKSPKEPTSYNFDINNLKKEIKKSLVFISENEQ